MNYLLVPIDFSEASETLFHFSISLAVKQKKPVLLLYILDIEEFDSFMEYYKKRKEAEILIRKRIEGAYLSKIDPKLIDELPVKLTIRGGYISERVIQAASWKTVDEIVISSMPTGIHKEIFKSIEDIIETSSKSVWIVPDTIHNSLKNLIYATDYQKEDIPSIMKLSKLASLYDARITVLHISKDIDVKTKFKEAAFRQLINEKSGYQNIDFRIVKGDKVADNIINYKNKVNADLVVMLKRDKNLARKLFTKKVTKKVTHSPELPVLIYH